MGRINYSSAELTAVDIIQFASNIGGYQRAATVLAELVDVLDMSKIPFEVNNKWFSGKCEITAYALD